MSGSKGREVYNQLSVTLYNEGFHDHATDIALIDAALRAAKVEGLRDGKRIVNNYNFDHNHGKSATLACDNIADLFDARIAELEREGEQHGA